LWAFDIEPGLDEEGKKTVVDPDALTDGLVTSPLPFKVSFKPRGEWVRQIIKRECDTPDSGFVDILNGIGKELSLNK
jgi:hypothetical protein